jgi:hypothetical protein
VHTKAEHGRATSFSTPKIISVTALHIAISMPFPSMNRASKNLSVPAGTKTVFCVGPLVETGIVSFIVSKSSPDTISSITAPSKFGGGICLTICSLESSVDESVKNSSGSWIRRLIEAPFVPPPPAPLPQVTKYKRKIKAKLTFRLLISIF